MSASITGIGVIAPPRHGMRFPPSQSAEAPAVAAEPTGAFAVAKEDSQSKREEAAEVHGVLRPEARTAIVPSLASRQLAALCDAALRAKVQAHLRMRTRALTAAVPTRAWLESRPPARSHHSYVFADAVRHTDTPTGAPGELLPSTLTWHASDWRVQTVLHPMSTSARVNWADGTSIQVQVENGTLKTYEEANKQAEALERDMRNEFLTVYFGSTWQQEGGAAQKIQETLDRISENRDMVERYAQNTKNVSVKSADVDKIVNAFKEHYPNVQKTVRDSGAKNLLEYEAMRLLPGYVRPAVSQDKLKDLPPRVWRLDTEVSQAKTQGSRQRYKRTTQLAAWMVPAELKRVTAMVVAEHLCTSSEWKLGGEHYEAVNKELAASFQSRASNEVHAIEKRLENATSVLETGAKEKLDELQRLGADVQVPERPSCTEILKKHAPAVLGGLLDQLGSGLEELADVSGLWNVAVFKMRVVTAADPNIKSAIQRFQMRAENQFEEIKKRTKMIEDMKVKLRAVQQSSDQYNKARVAFEAFECSRQFVAARNAAGKQFRDLIELSNRLSSALEAGDSKIIREARDEYVENRKRYIRAAMEMMSSQDRTNEALRSNWLTTDSNNLKTRYALSMRRAELRYDLSRFGARCKALDQAEKVQFENEMIQEEGRKRAAVEMYSQVAILGEILSLQDQAEDKGDAREIDDIKDIKKRFTQMQQLTQVLYPPSTMRELDNTSDQERLATGSDGKTTVHGGGYLTGELSGPALKQRANRAEDWWPAVSHLGQAASTTFNTMFKEGTMGDDEKQRNYADTMELDDGDDTTLPQRAYTSDMLAFAMRNTMKGVEARVKRDVDAELEELQGDLEKEQDKAWFKHKHARLKEIEEQQKAESERQAQTNAEEAVLAYFQKVTSNAEEAAERAGFLMNTNSDGTDVSIRQKQYATTYKHARRCDALAFMQGVLDNVQEGLYNEEIVPWKPAITFVKAEHVLHQTPGIADRLADDAKMEEVTTPKEDWLIRLADEHGNVRPALDPEVLARVRQDSRNNPADIEAFVKAYRSPQDEFGMTLRPVGVYPKQWDDVNRKGDGFDWDDGGFTRRAGVPNGVDPSTDPNEKDPYAPFAETVRKQRTADEPPTFYWLSDDAGGGAAYLTSPDVFEKTGQQFKYDPAYHGPWVQEEVSQRWHHIGVPHPWLLTIADDVELEEMEYYGRTVDGVANEESETRSSEAEAVLHQVSSKQAKLFPAEGELHGVYSKEAVATWWYTPIETVEDLTEDRKDLLFKMAVVDNPSATHINDRLSESYRRTVANQFEKLEHPKTNGAFVTALTNRNLDAATASLQEYIAEETQAHKEKETLMRGKPEKTLTKWLNGESKDWKVQIRRREISLSYLRHNPDPYTKQGWAYLIEENEKQAELLPCEYKEAIRIMHEEKYAGMEGPYEVFVEHLSEEEKRKPGAFSLVEHLNLQDKPSEVQNARIFRWLLQHGMTRSEAVQQAGQEEESDEEEPQPGEEEDQGGDQRREQDKQSEEDDDRLDPSVRTRADLLQTTADADYFMREEDDDRLDPSVRTRDDLLQTTADADYFMRMWVFKQQQLRMQQIVDDQGWMERFNADTKAQKAFKEVAKMLTHHEWFANQFGKREPSRVEELNSSKRRKGSGSDNAGAAAEAPEQEQAQQPNLPMADEEGGGRGQQSEEGNEQAAQLIPQHTALSKSNVPVGLDTDESGSEMEEEAAADCSDGVSAQRVPPSSSVSSVAKQLARAMALHSHAWHTQPHWWQR